MDFIQTIITTIIGFLLGFLSTILYDIWKNCTHNKLKRESLKSFLKAEQNSNLDLLKSLNTCWKIEGLFLSSNALIECLKNPHLFEQKLFLNLIELNSNITFYNTRIPNGDVRNISLLGIYDEYNKKFQDLKFKLQEIVSII
jgi:hypothetical protein